MARPLPLASQRRKQQGNEYAGNVSSLPYTYTKKKKRRTKGAKREGFFFWLGPFFLNKLFFTCSKTSLAVNLFPFLLTVPSTTLHYRVCADHLHDGSPAERALATAARQLICTFRASTHVPTPAIVSPERFKSLQITHHTYTILCTRNLKCDAEYPPVQ